MPAEYHAELTESMVSVEQGVAILVLFLLITVDLT